MARKCKCLATSLTLVISRADMGDIISTTQIRTLAPVVHMDSLEEITFMPRIVPKVKVHSNVEISSKARWDRDQAHRGRTPVVRTTTAEGAARQDWQRACNRGTQTTIMSFLTASKLLPVMSRTRIAMIPSYTLSAQTTAGTPR
jgi:hypothetical protein